MISFVEIIKIIVEYLKPIFIYIKYLKKNNTF